MYFNFTTPAFDEICPRHLVDEDPRDLHLGHDVDDARLDAGRVPQPALVQLLHLAVGNCQEEHGFLPGLPGVDGRHVAAPPQLGLGFWKNDAELLVHHRAQIVFITTRATAAIDQPTRDLRVEDHLGRHGHEPGQGGKLGLHVVTDDCDRVQRVAKGTKSTCGMYIYKVNNVTNGDGDGHRLARRRVVVGRVDANGYPTCCSNLSHNVNEVLVFSMYNNYWLGPARQCGG